MRKGHKVWVLGAGIILSGCGSSVGNSEIANLGPVTSSYDLANRCFNLQVDGEYAVRNGTALIANGTDPAPAEKFFMRAANLGRFVFYTADQRFLTANGTAVSAATAPADGSDWTFTRAGDGFHAATLGGGVLGLSPDKQLELGSTAALLSFTPATGCTQYPEMPTGVIGEAFTNPATGPVVGFAEVHAHMGMGMEMSDGSKNVGPASAGVMYGHAVNRFGVIEAIKDCAGMHGENGSSDPEAAVLDQTPGQTHDTTGWPTFVDWPKRDSQLHQQMYYKWVERAYMAGLRTMSILGTNIEALCEVGKQAYGNSDGDPDNVDCIDMSVGMKQIRYVYDIQDYVDAQFGGPGKGWFRIVKDPAEARAVIAQGKLAVIPGLEFSNIFGCNVIFNEDGSETRMCTREQIDQQIDEAWEAGIRQVFPYHDVDSALGGTGIFSSTLNLIGYYGTQGFWQTYPCEDGGEGPKFLYTAGAVMESDDFSQYNDPISQQLAQNAAGRYPFYGPGRQCNARQVTDLGEYAIDKIMKKGFLFDIDHAEIKSKQYMLDLAARFTPNYPMISGHGGHGGINNVQAAQIIRQGGIIYPSVKNGADFMDFVRKMKPIWNASGAQRPLSVGYGADTNGLANLPGPRGASADPIVYPFTLFRGADWGAQFERMNPVTFERLAVPGGKVWDMNEEGMAHYGMIADIAEEIRIEGGTEGVNAFYNSAETFLKMWEQTQAASVEARKVPSPP